MRAAFVDAMLDLASKDERIWLLCGDVGYTVLERFRERFPDRFINVGVAEQNMIGIAAGLAQSGHVAFCYSIANFPTLRCLEQIRNDVCHHNGNVSIVSVGGGVAYGVQGYSHHALEDLAVMRALPNMVVAAPGDPIEVGALTYALAKHQGPGFLRLDKAGETRLHDSVPWLEIGQVLPLSDGEDVTLLSTGGMLEIALDVAARLNQGSFSAGVTSVPFVKPLDAAYVTGVAHRTTLLCTLEEHGPIGGLGESVGACLARLSGGHARFLPFSFPEVGTTGMSGQQQYLRAQAGLNGDSIFATIMEALAHGSGKLQGTAPAARPRPT